MIKLKFIGANDDQNNWGGNDDPQPLMNIGDIVTLDHKEVHSWHTKIYLKEFPGKKFNSVCFKPVIKEQIMTEWKEYKRKPEYVKAARWFKHGDLEEVKPSYLLDSHTDSYQVCLHCHLPMKDHGICYNGESALNVCPGDYIIKNKYGDCKPELAKYFEEHYENRYPQGHDVEEFYKDENEETEEVKKVNAWLDSAEGQETVITALKEGLKHCEELRKAREISPEIWTKPMDI